VKACNISYRKVTTGNMSISHDDVRWTTKLPQLTAIVQAQCLSLFGHIERMPDKTDAKKILRASNPWRTGVDHQDVLVLCGWRLSSRTWNPITSPWIKQLTCVMDRNTREPDVYGCQLLGRTVFRHIGYDLCLMFGNSLFCNFVSIKMFLKNHGKQS